jgi:hypothetical protein
MKRLTIGIAALSLCACTALTTSVDKDTYWTLRGTDPVSQATEVCESQGKAYERVMELFGRMLFHCVDTPPPATGSASTKLEARASTTRHAATAP